MICNISQEYHRAVNGIGNLFFFSFFSAAVLLRQPFQRPRSPNLPVRKTVFIIVDYAFLFIFNFLFSFLFRAALADFNTAPRSRAKRNNYGHYRSLARVLSLPRDDTGKKALLGKKRTGAVGGIGIGHEGKTVARITCTAAAGRVGHRIRYFPGVYLLSLVNSRSLRARFN